MRFPIDSLIQIEEETMKLRNIYVLCKDNYHVIDNLSASEITINGRTGRRVTGWDATREVLVLLMEVESLKKEAQNLIDKVPAFYRNEDSFDISSGEWNSISSAKNMLLRTMDDTIDLYEKMGMEIEEKVGLDIKLPEFKDFSEFVNYLKNIEFILTKCPFLKAENEELVFDNVDVGSTWLTFFVVGTTALAGGSVLLNNLAAFIDKCIIIRSHYLSVQQQKMEVKKEQKDNQKKEVILEYLDGLYKKDIENAIKEMESMTSYKVENKDGDEYLRIKDCFERTGELLEKGMKIYSSIDSPQEVRALFEPLKMKYIGMKDTLELTDKKNENK